MPELELPFSLVEELLEKNESIGNELLKTINSIQKNREEIRKWLEENNKIKVEKENNSDIPTTCAIDGSFVIERMMSSSVVACAAVGIEGFTTKTKHWQVKHDSMIQVETHDPELGNVVRGLMKVMETKLAVNAPHEVVLLDGSITSQIIHMNQAIHSAIKSNSLKIVDKKLLEEYKDFLYSFRQILTEENRIFASLPKYTSRSEIGDEYNRGWPEKQDDKSVFTTLLKSGEYTTPLKITREDEQWHLPLYDSESLVKECMKSMEQQMVFYYKPHEFSPALRIEINEKINNESFDKLLKSIKSQYTSYAIMEPYPLYMADRIVKSLSNVMPTLRQSALQKITNNSTTEIKDILFSVRNYRTEGY